MAAVRRAGGVPGQRAGERERGAAAALVLPAAVVLGRGRARQVPQGAQAGHDGHYHVSMDPGSRQPLQEQQAEIYTYMS